MSSGIISLEDRQQVNGLYSQPLNNHKNSKVIAGKPIKQTK